MSNGHGITTVNLYQNDLDGFLQAIMRERKFLNANGQTMDCILSSKAARDVFNGESVKMEDLLSRMLGNLAKSVTRQQIQAVTLQLRELPKKFIKQKLFQSMPKDNFDNLAWANFEQIRSNTSELMASVENFGVDDWAKCRSWQEVKTVLERQWSGIQSKLRLAFDQQDIAALNWEVSGYINELDRNLQALFFDGHGQVEVGNGEVSVVQEQQQVQEQVQEQEQELKMEQELEQLYQMFRLDLEVAPRRPTEITALRGQAWDVVNKWQPTSFTQMIQWQRTDIVSNLTSKQKEVYDSVYEIANAFSKFDGELLATDNFHRTTTSVQENIFSGYQKNVKYLLMCWDDGGLFRKQIIPKCVFLAENDVDNIRSAIDSGTLTNCYLCTTNGVRISKPANNCEVELSSKQKEFIGQNEWVAHFFNSDIEWLNTHADITEKMFIKMGMPASGRERAQFLKGIRNFLVMRSKDPKETHKAVMDSSLFLHGRLNDPYALFLAEHSLSKFSAPHTIVESIMKMPNWKDLLSLAFDGEASPANVKNTAIEQGKIIENTGIKIENVHEEISTRNREIEEAKKEVSELISNPEFRPELEKEARENRITELRLKISRTEEIVFFLMEKGKEFMSKMVEAKEAIWELLGNVRRGITSLFKT
jgi:hypothetical protein